MGNPGDAERDSSGEADEGQHGFGAETEDYFRPRNGGQSPPSLSLGLASCAIQDRRTPHYPRTGRLLIAFAWASASCCSMANRAAKRLFCASPAWVCSFVATS